MNKKNRLITTILLCYFLSGCAWGDLSKEAVWYPSATEAQALKDLAEIEKQRLELDKQKLELERQIQTRQRTHREP